MKVLLSALVATALLLSSASANQKTDGVQALEEDAGYWSRFVQEVADSLATPEPSSPPSPAPSPGPSPAPSSPPTPAPSPGPSPGPTIEPECLVKVSAHKIENLIFHEFLRTPNFQSVFFLRSNLTVSLSMVHPAKT
jgi:hypothetical protein